MNATAILVAISFVLLASINTMRNLFLFLILVELYGCNSQTKTSSFPDSSLNVEITKERFLDKSIPDSMKIYMPVALQTDLSGNVYIFDNAEMDIKVFSEDGKPLQIIGGRGRGPGEFISTSGFFVYRNSLYVFDQDLQRLNVFSTDGTLETTFPFNVTVPVILKPLGKDLHLGIYSSATRTNDDNIRYAHVLNSKFLRVNDPFLNIPKLIPELEDVKSFLKFLPGNFLMRGKESFIYTPYFYNGKLYMFKKTKDDTWKHTSTYQGHTDHTPFTKLDNNLSRHPDLSMASVGENETPAYVVHNQSRGLLEYKDKIYHFTQCEFDDNRAERVFGVEVFNNKMQPVGYKSIKAIPIINKPGNTIGWHAEAVDQDGHFYIRERNRDKNTIWMLKFNWHKVNP